MSATKIDLEMLRSEIDRLGVQVKPTTLEQTMRVGAREVPIGDVYKMLAAFMLKLDEAPLKIQELMEEQASVSGAQQATTAAAIGRVRTRLRTNRDGRRTIAAQIRDREAQMSRLRTAGLETKYVLDEIIALRASDRERAAIDLELRAELVEAIGPELKRKALAIRLDLKIDRAERDLQLMYGQPLEEMVALAQSVVTTLTRRIARQKQRAEAGQRAIEAEAKARAEAEAKARAEADAAAKAAVDPGLAWLMQADSHDPTNPEEVAIAAQLYPLADIETARELAAAAQQTAT